MSAFIVSKRHIDVIVSRAQIEVTGPDGSPLSWSNGTPEGGQYPKTITTDELGRMLWGENLKSVIARYPGDRDGHRPGPAGFRDLDVLTYRAVLVVPFPTRIEVLKALDRLEYQSCEHEGWKTSEAAAFCEALRRRLISHLPGYEEAPEAWD